MLYFTDNLTVHFQNLKMHLCFHQAVAPQRNNSEENTKQETAKIEDYQVIHTRRKNLQRFLTGLVKHKLLKRVGKKGLYDAGPQLWQHGVQRPPTKCQSHSPVGSHPLGLHFIFSAAHSSLELLVAILL